MEGGGGKGQDCRVPIRIEVIRVSPPRGDPLPLPAYATEGSAGLDLRADVPVSLSPGEIHICRFDAEVSDFVRMNRGKVRQPGTVSQCYLSLRLIHGTQLRRCMCAASLKTPPGIK